MAEGETPFMTEEQMKELSLQLSQGTFEAMLKEGKYPDGRGVSLDDIHWQHENILTEDGEPMLNPAELLTQESLASPPPS